MPDVRDPVGTSTTPQPGWYADPESPAALRFWDGAGWTDRRRQAAADRGGPPAPAGRRWGPIAAVAVSVLVVIILVAVVSRGSSDGGHPAAAKTAAGSRTAGRPGGPAAPPTACTYPEPRPSASDILWWYGVHQKLPTVATPQVKADLPAGGCSAAAFSDARVATAVNFVIAMPTAPQAATLAQSLGGASFADDQYVVELDPREAPFASGFQSALTAYLKATEPTATP